MSDFSVNFFIRMFASLLSQSVGSNFRHWVSDLFTPFPLLEVVHIYCQSNFSKLVSTTACTEIFNLMFVMLKDVWNSIIISTMLPNSLIRWNMVKWIQNRLHNVFFVPWNDSNSALVKLYGHWQSLVCLKTKSAVFLAAFLLNFIPSWCFLASSLL